MSHVTWTPLSRSKGQGHQAVLLSKELTRQPAAAVTVGTYCYVAVCRRHWLGSTRRFGAQRRRGVGHIVTAAHLQLVSIRSRYKTVAVTVLLRTLSRPCC